MSTNILTRNSNVNSQNYNCIDLIKFMAAIAVVLIHTSPFTSISEDLNFYVENIIARFGVPFFFATTGFFFFSKFNYKNGKIEKSKENNKIFIKFMKRTVVLYTLWSLIYLFISIPIWISIGWFSLAAFIDFILSFFFIGSYYHLWYMLVIIYAIPIMYFIMRLCRIKHLISFIIILYFLSLVTYNYSWLFEKSIGVDIYAILGEYVFFSSLPRGISFIGIGILLSNKKFVLSKKNHLICLITCFIMLSIEVWMNYYIFNNFFVSNLLFTLPFAFFLLNFALSCNLKGNLHTYLQLRKISSFIYFVHPLLITLLNDLNFNSVVWFLIILTASILSSFMIIKLSNLKQFSILKYLY